MPLDPDKLRRDVEKRAADRPEGSGRDGRLRTGTMATVRQHLGTIMALRDGGATWLNIAAALAEQGVVQGDGLPLTGRHLTALIASIRRQDVSRAAARGRRLDLRHAPEVELPVAAMSHVEPKSSVGVDRQAEVHLQGSPEAMFDRLDRKARQMAEAAAERPDFSKGLIK